MEYLKRKNDNANGELKMKDLWFRKYGTKLFGRWRKAPLSIWKCIIDESGEPIIQSNQIDSDYLSFKLSNLF